MYDLVEFELPAVGGIVGVFPWGSFAAGEMVEVSLIIPTGCDFGRLAKRLDEDPSLKLTPLVVVLTAQLTAQLINLSESTNAWWRKVAPTKRPGP